MTGFDRGRWRMLLQVGQDLVCPVDDLSGQPGQLGDVNAVASVGAAGDNLVKKHHFISLFGDGHVVVFH